MLLTKPLWVEVESIVTNKVNRLRLPDEWITVHQESESPMEDKHERKKVDNSPGDMPCVPYVTLPHCLSIVVEDQVLVNPVLYENNEEIVNIQRWHA